MLPVLALLLLALPVVELYVIVQISRSLGVLETVALLVLISVVGVALVRRAGLGALARVQADVARGDVPTRHLLDGLLVLVAGILLVLPGFLTDVVAVLLLLPPTRAVVRSMLVRGVHRRVRSGVRTRTGRFGRVSEVIVLDDRHTGDEGRGPADGRGPHDPPSLPRG